MSNIDGKIGYVSINPIPKEFKQELDTLGIIQYSVERSIRNPFKYIYNLSRIAKDYDVIHVHGNSATMALEMIASYLAGVKVRIAHSHNTSCSYRHIDSMLRPLFYKLCNFRMACGIEAGKWLFKNRDFELIHNGINCNRFSFNNTSRTEFRKALKIEDSNKVIINIANFVPAKNHEFLIRVFKRLIDKDSNYRLLLLGTGPLVEKIRESVNEINIESKVIFAGSVNNPESYLSASDLMLMPSLHEGLPLTMIEAQANGLPILTSTNVTLDVNISGLVKFLPLSEDLSTWVDGIASLSSTEHNRETSSKAIEAIRDAGYDIEGVVEKLLESYKEYLDKSQS